MLDDRKAAILRAVVEEYIETADPVGSAHVARSGEVAASAATVRTEMALLEREGYLVQPHTSAGRIPTNKGYRYFVDQLAAPGSLDAAKHQQVRDFFSQAHGRLERMLADTSRLLVGLTDYAAVVLKEGDDSDSPEVFVGGASRMASAFETVDTVREVLRTLEQQFVVVSLLRDLIDRGVSVAIGAEHGVLPLADCSVVVAPYDVEGERVGTIGVLGPTRMHYPEAMSAVAVVSRRLGESLAEASSDSPARNPG